MNFNIHDLLKFRVEGINNKQLKHFCQSYSYFKTDEKIKSELDIIFSNFTPENNSCIVVDQKYHVKKNYLFCNDGYKTVRWNLCIKNIENKPTVYFNGGLFSEIFLRDEIIEPLIEFKLSQKECSLLHASSIVIDNKGFIFAGGPGAGKTSIILNLMRKNNAFLSDELSILSNDGTVYNYPLPISIYNYNLKNIFRFYDRVGASIIFKIKLKYLIYRLSLKYLKLHQDIEAEKLFDRIDEKSQINSLVLLSKMSKNKMKLIQNNDREEFVKRLIFVNKYQFRLFSEYLTVYSSCYPKSKLGLYWQMLEKNLLECAKKVHCFEIEIPSKYDYSSFEEFENILNEMKVIVDDEI